MIQDIKKLTIDSLKWMILHGGVKMETIEAPVTLRKLKEAFEKSSLPDSFDPTLLHQFQLNDPTYEEITHSKILGIVGNSIGMDDDITEDLKVV
jgi:hypothetical protein